MSDPVADFLTRIRNAYRASKLEAKVPFSKEKEAICQVLLRYNFIESFKVTGKEKKQLQVLLRYKSEKKAPAIEKITCVSKPGRRVYKKSSELKLVLQGFGIAVLSTSQGIMSDFEARQKNLGGEVICEVW